MRRTGGGAVGIRVDVFECVGCAWVHMTLAAERRASAANLPLVARLQATQLCEANICECGNGTAAVGATCRVTGADGACDALGLRRFHCERAVRISE